MADYRQTSVLTPEEESDKSPESSPVEIESNKRQVNFVRLLVGLLAACMILSYFVKPKAPMSDLVIPEQELPGFEARYPGDTGLSQRVMSSYGLAMVLFQTPYTDTNVSSLENLRSWAKERFQATPDFLHPVSVRPQNEPNDTVIGALGYNLFASIHYSLQGIVGEVLRARIADFHGTSAYRSFQLAFFDLFGKDTESATLLARYQSDQAKKAIDIIIWTLVWTAYALVSAIKIVCSPRRQRFEKIRYSLVGVWLLIGIAHASSAWMDNSIPSMITSLVSFTFAAYFFKPFVLRTRDDASLKVTFVQLNSKWIALSSWFSCSLVAITLLTWIRASLPDAPDPITLFFQGMSGNFLHDPGTGKGIVMRAVGLVWLAISLWAFSQRKSDAKAMDELDAELKSL